MRAWLCLLIALACLVAPSPGMAGRKFTPPRILDFQVDADLRGHVDFRTNVPRRLLRSVRQYLGADLVWLPRGGGQIVNPGSVSPTEEVDNVRFAINPMCDDVQIAIYQVTPDNRLRFVKGVGRSYTFSLPNRHNEYTQDYVVCLWCEDAPTDSPEMLWVSIDSSPPAALRARR